jgi:hypothetical protein|tara:strand:- start:2623 stop:2784 length:162 start_codon:yes stop_codon:yes gene_type:complete
MGCPVHLWAPIMALLLPFARAIKSFFFKKSKKHQNNISIESMTRFKPINNIKK